MDRKLDGYYFRVKRNDKYENVCFSDLTREEMEEVLKDKSIVFLQGLCIGLGKTIKTIGNALDLEGDY